MAKERHPVDRVHRPEDEGVGDDMRQSESDQDEEPHDHDRTKDRADAAGPSPPLSARITNRRYFTETVTTSDQKIKESTPRIFAGVTSTACVPAKHSRRA